MPAFPDLAQPLVGSVARLRPAAERDIPEVLIAHQDDPRLHTLLGTDRPPSGAELGRRTEREAADRAAGTGAWLTIVAADDAADECAGQLDVTEVDWDHGRASLRLWIVPQRRGRGLATDALRVAGGWLLDDCGLARVQLEVGADNEPMLAAAAAAGYAREGRLRGYQRVGRQRIDVEMMALVRRS